jgi:hypothetical protein
MRCNFKKYLDFRLLGIIGALFLILSEFLPWFSGNSLLGLYMLYLSLEIEFSFLYIFPIISGIICLIGTVLILYKQDYRINTAVINFIGLGFFLIFLFELIPREFPYVNNAEIGFYFAIAGGILIIFDILNILLLQDKE